MKSPLSAHITPSLKCNSTHVDALNEAISAQESKILSSNYISKLNLAIDPEFKITLCDVEAEVRSLVNYVSGGAIKKEDCTMIMYFITQKLYASYKGADKRKKSALYEIATYVNAGF